MANMSYCRFHNTSMDMDDCIEALVNEESLSGSEAHKCVQMFRDIMEYLEGEGVIEFDFDAFNEWKNEIMDRVDD